MTIPLGSPGWHFLPSISRLEQTQLARSGLTGLPPVATARGCRHRS
jgi:hypothetical protein